MTTIGCQGPSPAEVPRPARHLVVADVSVTHAFDTHLELRLIDRPELDSFLRDGDIQVAADDGVVYGTGEVWTPLEKRRVGDLLRHVAGVIDVANQLEVRPPA